MANISVTMNVTSIQDVYLKNNVKDPATDEVIFIPQTSLFAQDSYLTFSNFVSFHRDFQSMSGDSTLRTNTDMKWDSSGIGDVMHSKWFFIRGPGIVPDTANSYEEAYYINEAPFRMVSWLELRAGQLRITYMDDLLLEMEYTHDHPNAKLSEDPYCHRFQTKAGLQRASVANVTWTMPICDQFSRANKLQNGFFQYLFAKQNTDWRARFRGPKEFTCHVLPSGATITTTGTGTATDTVPLVYGTSTGLSAADFRVELWATFYILDPAERAQYLKKEITRQLHSIRHESYVSNEASGSLVQKDNVTMNDPTKCITLTFQPDAYLDGTMCNPYSPGLKHPFCFVPYDGLSGLDEWFIEVQWSQNALKLLENNPIQFLRNVRHVEMFGEPSRYGSYDLANQPMVNDDILIHTVNQSRIDKLTFSWKKNTNLAGTVHILQYYVGILTMKDQVGGVPFQ